MSEIKSKASAKTIQNTEDVIERYQGTLTNPHMPDTRSRLGIELEYNLYDTNTLNPLDEAASGAIIEHGRQSNMPIHREPSMTTLELLTDPFTPNEITTLIDQIESRFSSFIGAMHKNNSFASPFAHLPHIAPEDHHLTQNERYLAFWVPTRDDMQGIFQSFLYPNIQSSVSYSDYDHLLRIIRLSVALEPLLFLTTDASSNFYDGKPADFCARFKMFATRGRNGGIPDFYYSARNGEELIHDHINHILNNPHMFAAFDHGESLKQLPSGKWPSFLELEEKGYGPQDILNYRQSQSESWRRAANIAEIRDDKGTVFGYRAELSSLFATGLQHQRISAILLTYLIAYSEDFYNQIGVLLLDFDIDLDALDQSKPLLNQNYKEATHHKGRYHELPFGTKTVKDFAQQFANIIEQCIQDTDLAGYAAPLLHILRKGRPDWLVYREAFSTLEETKDYLRKLPALTKDEPDLTSALSCADWTLPKILKKAA